MTPRRIVIDTDPGHDDAVALLVALASPELEVVAVTAVAGNVPLAKTGRNARVVCELAGRPDVPVYAGADAPLVHDLVTAEYVHGESGLDGADLPEPAMPLQEQHAVEFLVELLLAEPPGSITLCTLGALTNVATALRQEPRIAPRIAELVMMGGSAFEGGNRTPAAEFNIYVDPHAADIVFRSGIPLTMMPLDVTHRALLLPKRRQAIRALGTPVAEAVAGWMDFFQLYDLDRYESEGGPLHDPCVIAYLLEPEIFSGKDCYVAVETESRLTVGMTVVDWWGATTEPPNARVIRDLDADRFFALITERLGRL